MLKHNPTTFCFIMNFPAFDVKGMNLVVHYSLTSDTVKKKFLLGKGLSGDIGSTGH